MLKKCENLAKICKKWRCLLDRFETPIGIHGWLTGEAPPPQTPPISRPLARPPVPWLRWAHGAPRPRLCGLARPHQAPSGLRPPPSVAWQGHIRPLCGLARPHQAPPPAEKVNIGGRGRRGTPRRAKNTKSGLIGVAVGPFVDPTAWFCTEFRPGCSRGTPVARSRLFF